MWRRGGVSPALELDEAEQALWVQNARLGLWQPAAAVHVAAGGWFALVLGRGVLALSSLKFMLLGLTLVLMVWRTALPLDARARGAVGGGKPAADPPPLGWNRCAI